MPGAIVFDWGTSNEPDCSLAQALGIKTPIEEEDGAHPVVAQNRRSPELDLLYTAPATTHTGTSACSAAKPPLQRLWRY